MKKHLSGYLVGMMIAASGLAGAGSVSAQEASAAASRPVLTLYHVEVKHGHSRQWSEGIAALKACYAEQKGKHSWWTWARQDGPGVVYTVVAPAANWAVFDSPDEQMRACYSIFDEKVNPHEISVSTRYIRPHKELHQPASGTIARVTGLVLNDYDKFMEVAKAVTDTYKSEKRKPREWYDALGGSSTDEDVLIVRRYANYAAMDADEETNWAMMKRVHGEEKANALRAQSRETIDGSWTYLYEFKPELSYEPAK